MKKLLPLWMFLPIFLVLAACSDNSEDIDRYYATVSTPKVTTTTPTSLTVTASVTGDLNQIVKKGFCYSAAASVPTIKDHVVDADENFSASLSTLTSGTSYYIRAYVYCDSRYVYSEVVTATTESLSLDDELKNYVAPTYSDDYTSISDWSKRSQWNLANVHAPLGCIGRRWLLLHVSDGCFIRQRPHRRRPLPRSSLQGPCQLGIPRRYNEEPARMGSAQAQ